MSLEQDVSVIVRDVLLLDEQALAQGRDTQLLGAIPEFDSMAVVSIVTALEEEFGCMFDDDEISAEIFQTIGSLTDLVESKVG